jgi:hypothetical protein
LVIIKLVEDLLIREIQSRPLFAEYLGPALDHLLDWFGRINLVYWLTVLLSRHHLSSLKTEALLMSIRLVVSKLECFIVGSSTVLTSLSILLSGHDLRVHVSIASGGGGCVPSVSYSRLLERELIAMVSTLVLNHLH